MIVTAAGRTKLTKVYLDSSLTDFWGNSIVEYYVNGDSRKRFVVIPRSDYEALSHLIYANSTKPEPSAVKTSPQTYPVRLEVQPRRRLIRIVNVDSVMPQFEVFFSIVCTALGVFVVEFWLRPKLPKFFPRNLNT